jgi:putative transposase
MWVADITYVRTDEGFSVPVFRSRCPLEETRRMGDGDPPQNRTRYGCSAAGALVEQTGSGTNPPCRPGSAVHLFELRKAARRGRFVPSMGRIGSAHDNPLAESFVATLKSELLYRGRWPTSAPSEQVPGYEL